METRRIKALFAIAAGAVCVCAACPSASGAAAPFVVLDDPASPRGYLELLLINEAPFPGEKGYVSEADTRATMEAVLWVLHGRLKHIPPGYTQQEVAAAHASDIIGVITAGGQKGQCDGFYRASDGRPAAVPRVEERVQYLLKIANRGEAPGRFSRLMLHARDLARGYMTEGISVLDRYAGLKRIGPHAVTGRAYSWMTDRSFYNPGGSFVAIPNERQGVLGGNRFFTLLQKGGN